MSKDAQRPGMAGFALTEALVAALLLALALMGSGAALVESLQAQHAALLQARAADLAADLAETIRARPAAADFPLEVASWRAEAGRALPWVTASIESDATSGFNVALRWREARTGRSVALTLPVATAALP